MLLILLESNKSGEVPGDVWLVSKERVALHLLNALEEVTNRLIETDIYASPYSCTRGQFEEN